MLCLTLAFLLGPCTTPGLHQLDTDSYSAALLEKPSSSYASAKSVSHDTALLHTSGAGATGNAAAETGSMLALLRQHQSSNQVWVGAHSTPPPTCGSAEAAAAAGDPFAWLLPQEHSDTDHLSAPGPDGTMATQQTSRALKAEHATSASMLQFSHASSAAPTHGPAPATPAPVPAPAPTPAPGPRAIPSVWSSVSRQVLSAPLSVPEQSARSGMRPQQAAIPPVWDVSAAQPGSRTASGHSPESWGEAADSTSYHAPRQWSGPVTWGREALSSTTSCTGTSTTGTALDQEVRQDGLGSWAGRAGAAAPHTLLHKDKTKAALKPSAAARKLAR
jgi:hypothetical protein